MRHLARRRVRSRIHINQNLYSLPEPIVCSEYSCAAVIPFFERLGCDDVITGICSDCIGGGIDGGAPAIGGGASDEAIFGINGVALTGGGGTVVLRGGGIVAVPASGGGGIVPASRETEPGNRLIAAPSTPNGVTYCWNAGTDAGACCTPGVA